MFNILLDQFEIKVVLINIFRQYCCCVEFCHSHRIHNAVNCYAWEQWTLTSPNNWWNKYYVSRYTNNITSGTSLKNNEKDVAVINYIARISVSLKRSPIIGINPYSLGWYILILLNNPLISCYFTGCNWYLVCVVFDRMYMLINTVHDKALYVV